MDTMGFVIRTGKMSQIIETLLLHCGRVCICAALLYLVCNLFMPRMYINPNPCHSKLWIISSQFKRLSCKRKAPGRFVQHPYKTIDPIKFQFTILSHNHKRLILDIGLISVSRCQ